MNFKLISDTFKTRVYVWGAFSFITNEGKEIKEFIPAKRLRDLRFVTKKIKLVCHSYNKEDDIFIDWFDTSAIFTYTAKNESDPTVPAN